MISREKLLDAAARVYAECGFRGATTRRIAEEAGVNEVTIFRHFGSKAALIDEAVRVGSAGPWESLPTLPDEPAHPERELTAWATSYLNGLRTSRSLIRKTMGEIEERPAAAPCAAEPTLCAARDLRRYMMRLYDAGLASRGQRRANGRNEDAYAAGAMLMSALFGDAMGRDVMPDMYPQPAEQAPAMYVRLFLCAIGAAEPATRTTVARRRGAGPRITPTTKKRP
jgi:AcrR family transcriptional regulator